MTEQFLIMGPEQSAKLSGGYDMHWLVKLEQNRQAHSVSANPQDTVGLTSMSVEGYVEEITRSCARGWAWSPASPDAVVQVEAVLEGRVIGRAVADRMRPDLKEGNYGNGCHGFEMAFDVLVTGETAPTLCVSGPDGPTRLPGAYEIRPSEMPEPGAGFQFVSVRSRDATPSLPVRPKGYVENVTRRGARGWAWSPSSPHTIVQVEAVLNGRVIGRAVAEHLRPDLKERGFGTGRYGFDITFDEPVTGENSPRVHVIAAEGPTHLPGHYVLGKPQQPDPHPQIESVRPNARDATSLTVNPEGYVERVTRGTASGWAWLPSSPDTIVQVEAILDGRVIGRAAADRMREDLKERNFGAGRHGFELYFVEPVRGDHTPTLQVIGPDGPTRLPGAHKLPPLETLEQSAPLNALSANGRETTSSPRLDPKGYVESVTRRGARGWAWSPAFPDAIVQVEAILDGRVIGRAPADRPRPDLLARNIGTGRYGFAMSFDEHATGENAPEFRVLVPSEHCLPGVKTLPPPTPEDSAPRCRSSIATWYKEHDAFTSKGPEYEEFDASLLQHLVAAPGVPRPLLMAFYLPQYHAIPENDRFWGTGFTEWRQIARGVSRFPGHYQPRIPRDLGFYDLNNLSTLRAQAELAKAAGIFAFAFYYYWFNGQRVLEKPLNLMLASDLDMPFMILWANENWTRTWDGSESEVLLKQDYRREDEDALLNDLARHFLDDRYVRVAGRPLFCIYNPQSIPDPAATLARWRSLLASRYGLKPLIFMAQTFGARDPRDYGFDGALEFPPHKTAEKLVGRLVPDAYSPGYTSQILTYDSFIETSLKEDPVEYPLIKTVVPSWDNESRRPNRSLTLEGLSPAKYQEWLRTLLARAMEQPILGTPIVAINAWNEWAEAAYLEPDVYYGASFLNATARAYSTALREYMWALSKSI